MIRYAVPNHLAVGCPHCKRGVGDACMNPRGNTLWGRPHLSRIKLARNLSAEAWTMFDLLKRLSPQVEAMNGTSVENEKLHDDYFDLMRRL